MTKCHFFKAVILFCYLLLDLGIAISMIETFGWVSDWWNMVSLIWLLFLASLCQMFLVGYFFELRHHRDPSFRSILYLLRLEKFSWFVLIRRSFATWRHLPGGFGCFECCLMNLFLRWTMYRKIFHILKSQTTVCIEGLTQLIGHDNLPPYSYFFQFTCLLIRRWLLSCDGILWESRFDDWFYI